MYRFQPLYAALAVAGLAGSCLPALAQSNPGAGSVPSPQADKPSNQIIEITATAQKRTQNVLRTPLALSVLSGDEMKSAGVSSALNLSELLPNTEIGKGFGGGIQVTLRGIGSTDDSERGDPAAAVHIDGIYLGRTRSAGVTFYDLARIEVLRGPQGTLYGRNANAGVVNIITNKPSNKLEGSASLEAGNYSTLRLEGMINVPVNDMLGIRAVVSREKRDGFSDTANSSNNFGSDRDDLNNTSARLHVLFKPTSSISWLVTADGATYKGHNQASFNVSSGVVPSSRRLNPAIEGKTDNRAWGLTSEITANLGFADLTYLFGRREDKQDEAGSNAESRTWFTAKSNFKQDSHEIRLSSPAKQPLQWIAGVYSYKGNTANVDFPVFIGTSQLVRFFQNPARNESEAVFGQATVPVLDGLRLTGGLRYTQDRKLRKGSTFDGNNNLIGNVGNDADAGWSKSTYKLGLDYDLGKTALLFANLATGFKAGGFNDGNAVAGDANFNPFLYYKPESIRSLEVGAKGRFLDDRLHLSVAAFNYDYTEMQVQTVLNNSLVTSNAGVARVRGAEVEGKLSVGAAGRLDFSLGLLNSRYKQYTTPNGTSYAGRPLDKSPDTSFGLGYTHGWDLANGATLSANASTRYSSSYVLLDPGSITAAPKQIRQPSHTKSNLSLTYAPASGGWDVQVFVKNIEDETTMNALFSNNGANSAFLSEPRTFGLRGNLRF